MNTPKAGHALAATGLFAALQDVESAAAADLRRLHRESLSDLASGIRLKDSHPVGRVLSGASRITRVRFAAQISPERLRRDLHESVLSWVLTCSRLATAAAYLLRSDGRRLGVWLASTADRKEDDARVVAAFPGVRLEPDDPSDLLAPLTHAQLVTGVPVPGDPEDDSFRSIDRLVRGMRGRAFALAVVACPRSLVALQADLEEVRTERSRNFERVRRTLSTEAGESTARTVGVNGGLSANAGFSESFLLHAFRGLKPTSLGPGGFVGAQYSVTRTSSQSRSMSIERFDAFAEAYDAALKEREERLRIGVAYGAWECACYVLASAAADAALAAALWTGELASSDPPTEQLRAFPVISSAVAVAKLPWPSVDAHSGPMTLTSLVTTAELATLVALPGESHPGLDVDRVPRFALDMRSPAGPGATLPVRLGTVLDREVPLEGIAGELRPSDLCAHTLVTGITGSGKTTSVHTLLQGAGVPFIVIEPAKAEYRHLTVSGRPIRVLSAGDSRGEPLRLNPFEVPEGNTLVNHADALSAVLNAAFPMEGPMASLIEQAVLRAYEKKGWDVQVGQHPRIPDGTPTRMLGEAYPTIAEFYDVLAALIDEQGYAGDYGANVRAALLTRIRSLLVGSRGAMFETRQPLDMEELCSRPTVIELRALSTDESKAFVMGLLMLRLYRHFEHSASVAVEQPLRHLVVVEEAHRLFKKTGDQRGSMTAGNTVYRSVELFEHVLAEVRTYGLGLIVVEQQPTLLSDGALRNTSNKVAHRLSSRTDAEVVGGAMGLGAEESAFIAELRVGEALVYRADLSRPAHVRIEPHRPTASSVSAAREPAGRPFVEGAPPAGAVRARGLLEARSPGSVIDLGDRLLFTLLVGNLDDVDHVAGRAVDVAWELLRNVEDEPTATEACWLLADAAEAALRRRRQLEKDPLRLAQAVKALRTALLPLGTAHSLDADAALDLRRALVPPRRVGGNDDDRYRLEATNHAAAIRVELASGELPTTFAALIDVVRHKVDDRLLVVSACASTGSYRTALFAALASHLLSDDPGGATEKAAEYFAAEARSQAGGNHG